MLRLLKLEYRKLKSTKYFKILAILWLIAFISIPIVFHAILGYIASEDTSGQNFLLNPGNWPIFDFVDLWQNLTYAYKWITVFLCLNIVISTANEFSDKTIRQNVIDGLSRKEFWLSKISLIFVSSFIATLLLVILGLITGYILSPVTDFSFVIENIEFAAAYFLHLIHFLLFTFFVTVLLRRAGFAIALILFYVFIIEPLTVSYLYYNLELFTLAESLPMESGWSLIPMPFKKYVLMVTQDYVSIQDVLTACAWIGIFLFGSYKLITKRDL